MIDHSPSVRRARDGVRSWVRSAGSGLRRATPYGVVAFLAASAVAPVAGAALGAPAEVAAALGQLGGMGSNYLADALVTAADRARGGTEPDRLRDELAAEIVARLDARDEGAAALRGEIADLLRAVGAVEVALHAADAGVRQELVDAFGRLGADVGRLQVLAEDAAATLAAMHQELAEQGSAQRAQMDMIRQGLVATAQLRQELIGRRTAVPAGPDEPGADPGGPAPYPGMASFDALDARFFRGRETLVAELLVRLSEQVVGGPPLVVVGVSGSGKSSLLRAGVLPAIGLGGLGEGSDSWPWLVMTPGATPLAELTGRLAALGGDGSAPGRCVIVVDQFEELFTLCADPAERVAFTAALASAAPALVMIAVRADFYPQCTELPPLVDMLAGQIVVGSLSAAEMRRVIREPAAIAGYALEPGLEDLLLADMGELGRGGALPLLAHALRATWDRRDGNTMTVAGYRATGGIRRAVAETAEHVYLSLDEPGRAALRRAMLALVTIVDDVPVRRRASRAEVDLTVLAPMVAARLVTVGDDMAEVSHEALLTGWPRLAGWLVTERETILLRQRLAVAAADWAASGEDQDSLYRGARLDALRDWANAQRVLPEVQRRFLAAAESAAAAREAARRRTTRRLRRLVAGLSVALLLAVAGGLVALDQQGRARDNSRESRSRQLAAEARAEWQLDGLGAMAKAVDAWDQAPTREARDALLVAQQTVTVGNLAAEPGVHRVAVSPDGRRVAIGYFDGRVQLWDTTTLRRIDAGMGAPENLSDLRFSPDGRRLASASITRPGGVVLWDAATGARQRALPGVGSVAWLPDSSAVLSTRSDLFNSTGLVGTWDAASGRLIGSLPTRLRIPAMMAVTPDGTRVAVAGLGGVQVLRRRDGKATLSDFSRDYFDAVMTPDGKLLTVGGDDYRLESWDPVVGRRIARLDRPDSPLLPARIAVSPDNTVFAQVRRDNEIQRILTDGSGTRVTFEQFAGNATAIAMSADGHTMTVVGMDAPPAVYRMGVDRLPHPETVGFVAYEPGGLLVTQSYDAHLRLWDPRTSDLRATIRVPGGPGPPRGFAVSPDGTFVATTADGRIVVLSREGRLLRTMRLPFRRVARYPVLSPDGALLAVVLQKVEPDDLDGTPEVQLWDPRAGRLIGRVTTSVYEAEQLTFTRDGRRLIATGNLIRPASASGRSGTGGLWQWEVPGLRTVATTDLPPGVRAHDLAVSPDGATVAVTTTATTGGQVAMFRADGLAPLRRIGSHPYQMHHLAWSPDGRTLATASVADYDPVRLWDVRTGDLVAEVRGQDFRIEDVTFAPDGRTLVVGAGDRTAALYHLDPQEAVRLLCARLAPAAGVPGGRPLPRLCR